MTKETLKIASNGQWSLDKTEHKTSAIAAAAIASMISPDVANINIHSNQQNQPKIEQQKTVELRPDLTHIAFIESSSGSNKNHKLVNYGLNRGDKAAGSTGLMPITIKETISKNPHLKSKYGSLLDSHHQHITSFINSNENVEKEVANAHWDRLSRLFPRDELRRAYAWKNGITGAIKASDEEVSNHPYVKKFKALKYNAVADK